MKCACGCEVEVPKSVKGPPRKYASEQCNRRAKREADKAGRRYDEAAAKKARAFQLFADPDNTNWQISQRLGVHESNVSHWRSEWLKQRRTA